MATKPKDTPKVKVVITPRSEDNDAGFIRASTNDVIENGKRVLKQYRIKTGEEVELPETVAKQISQRYEMALGKDNQPIKKPLYFVEHV